MRNGIISVGNWVVDSVKFIGVYPAKGPIASRGGASGSDATPDDPVDRHAAVCGRTCVVALEKLIGNQFGTTFRKRKVWRLDEDGEYITEEK